MKQRLLHWSILVVVVLTAMGGASAAHAATGPRCYVNVGAAGTNDGNSWANAYTSLQTALAEANCTEIWVAAGTYKPTPGSDRAATFTLKNGVGIYGGFAGTETLRSERDPAAHVSILSGDIGGPGIADNVYHVVSAGTVNDTAVVDGLSISGGNANAAAPNDAGGGMYILSHGPAVTNLIFSDNRALNGGGMVNYQGTPILTNVTFSNNSATDPTFGSGGGMYNGNGSSPTLSNVSFSVNSAVKGGGMYNYNYSGPTLSNVTFSGNIGSLGGGMYGDHLSAATLTDVTFTGNHAGSGGGMYNYESSSTLTNVTFSGNSGGGGMYNYVSTTTLTNVTFSGNSGGAMYNAGSSPTIYDGIFWGDDSEIGDSSAAPTIKDSIVQGGCPSGAACANLITSNPLLGSLASNGGFTQTMALGAGSPAIDAGGVNHPCAATDQRGITRPQGPACDIGAYEVEARMIAGNAGVGGATLTYTGGTTTADIDGDYSFTVPYGWSGTVTPSLAGYTFAPDHKDYTNVTADQTEDYVATLVPTVVQHAAQGGLTGGACESWAHACELRYALAGSVSGQEIWAAAGTYTPSATTDRTMSFTLKNGVEVYGGFAGTETLLSARDPVAHVTVLSGEIGAPGIVDNSYHVVTGGGADSSAVLDGFTITEGNANGAGYPDNYGGGMFNESSSPSLASVIFSNNSAQEGGGIYNESSSPSLTDATFSGNAASDIGGGMYNDSSSPTLRNVTFDGNGASSGGGMFNDVSSNPSLTDVTFSDNSANGWGGGMDNIHSSPSLTNVTFSGNTAANDGGGMENYNNSSPSLTNVTFHDNSAGSSGGGMFNDDSSPTIWGGTFAGNGAFESGGAMYNVGRNTGHSNPTLINVTFYNNSAGYRGGAILDRGDDGGLSSPVLTNVTLTNNIAGDALGNAIYNIGNGSPNLTNVILWGNGLPDFAVFNEPGFGPIFVSHSVVEGGCLIIPSAACSPWGGNLSGDPLLGALQNNGGYTQTIALGTGSSAIDTGDDAVCANVTTVDNLDQRGVKRPQGAACDIGAYEFNMYNLDVHVGASLAGNHVVEGDHGQEHNYASTNGGPAQVTNTDGWKVVSSVRVLYGASSYSEMMGYPNNTTTAFWFPWYNNTAMDSQFRVSNLGTSTTTITVSLAGSPIDSFSLGAGLAIRKNYAGRNGGPLQVTSSGGVPILATIRVLYGGSSFSEMMGYPNNSTTAFWFPWYNNTAMDSQLRVSNVGVATTTITVYLGAGQIDSFSLGPGAALRKNYAGQNNGPMHVTSSDGVPILSTIRVLWGTSLSEMMGFPNNTTTDFWFPWYDNVGTDAQLRVSNLGGSTTTITVDLEGSPIDSFELGASGALRKNYAGLNSGALHVTSSGGMPILSTVRLLYAGTSFYELMGYPGNALTGTQYFPWYNNTAMNSQMRIGVP